MKNEEKSSHALPISIKYGRRENDVVNDQQDDGMRILADKLFPKCISETCAKDVKINT